MALQSVMAAMEMAYESVRPFNGKTPKMFVEITDEQMENKIAFGKIEAPATVPQSGAHANGKS
jgi:hypothetical protein